jgi:hypothetical protein
LLFRGGRRQDVPSTDKPLSSYSSTEAEVRLTISGQINAEENHREIQIIVDRDNARYIQYKGYNGEVMEEHQYPNTQAAYYNFLSALARAGFTDGDKSKALANETGRCPLGQRYVMEMKDGSKQLERFWATNCSGPKTYHGNLSLTLTLFQLQIPDYNELRSNVTL